MNIFTSTVVKKSAILIGLLLFIQFHTHAQGCSCPPVNSCGTCQSGFISFTLRYNGLLGLPVMVNDGSGTINSYLLVTTGQTITVSGSNPNGTFNGNQMSVFVTGIQNFSLNTSCGTPVSVGQNFGSFTVMAAASLAGGQLCCDIGDLETTVPVISSCPADIQLPSDASGCSKSVAWIPPTATDNCGAVTITSTHNPGAIFSVGSTEVVYTATDNYGNTSTCSFDVLVSDETDPVFAGCPLTDIIISADALCAGSVSWIEPTASDNCGAVTLVSSHSPGATFPLGTTAVLYTATDGAGNSSTCTFNVIVNDDTGPVITGCPLANIVTVADGSCEATVSWSPLNATDNCGPASFVSSHDAGDTFPLGTTTVLYTATDLAGNVSTCAFDVIVNDDAAPVIAGCPSTDIIAIAGASCQAVVSWTAPTALDNCGATFWVSSHDPGDTFGKGTTLVTYTATDATGNAATCSFNVIVEDSTAPVFAGCIASDIVVFADASCESAATWTAPVASDNCGISNETTTHLPGSTFPFGTTLVTYTAVDESGNIATCSFNVVVQDGSNPIIEGCLDVTAMAGQSCEAIVNWTSPVASDCGTVSIVSSHDSGDVFPIGTTAVTYTATDSFGNRSSCSFNVVVEDKTAPSIQNCLSDVVVTADVDCDATVQWEPPTATDNCGSVTMTSTHMPGDVFPLGNTLIKYTATDDAGNAAFCQFNIIVRNETPPQLTNCPEDISVLGDEYGEAVVEWIAPSASSNCGYVTLTSSHNSADVFGIGVTEVQYKAEDDTGNSSFCRFSVEVVEQEIEIDISKVVTPDGNGVNDEWIVTNIERFSNNKVVIVDRWGSVIYTATGYNNGSVVWRGLNRDGASVPTGTYFYTILVRYGEDSFEKTGFIELIQ